MQGEGHQRSGCLGEVDVRDGEPGTADGSHALLLRSKVARRQVPHRRIVHGRHIDDEGRSEAVTAASQHHTTASAVHEAEVDVIPAVEVWCRRVHHPILGKRQPERRQVRVDRHGAGDDDCTLHPHLVALPRHDLDAASVGRQPHAQRGGSGVGV